MLFIIFGNIKFRGYLYNAVVQHACDYNDSDFMVTKPCDST